jgi:hypothetical protein
MYKTVQDHINELLDICKKAKKSPEDLEIWGQCSECWDSGLTEFIPELMTKVNDIYYAEDNYEEQMCDKCDDADVCEIEPCDRIAKCDKIPEFIPVAICLGLQY